MSRILMVMLAGALLVPVLLLKAGYGFVNTFPYGSYQPVSVLVGAWLSIPMLLAGFCGLFLGLIYPRLTLWWGEANRGLVARVYIPVFLCGIFLQWEIRALSSFVSTGESTLVTDLYENLEAGLSLDEILAIQRRVAGGLRYTFVDDSDFHQAPGFPRKGRTTPAIKIGPGRYGFSNGVVVQMSGRRGDADARSERIVLVQNELVVGTKPPLTESDPRVYWGTFVIGPDRQSFTPCGEQELVLDTSEYIDRRADKSTDYTFFTAYERTDTEPYEPVRGIVVGYKQTSANGTSLFKILNWVQLEPARGFSSYTCDKPENGI